MVISQNQSTFIVDQQSLDGVLIANECIGVVIKKREKEVFCKLDLEKAYDLNWDFLDYMIGQMGFSIK